MCLYLDTVDFENSDLVGHLHGQIEAVLGLGPALVMYVVRVMFGSPGLYSL